MRYEIRNAWQANKTKSIRIETTQIKRKQLQSDGAKSEILISVLVTRWLIAAGTYSSEMARKLEMETFNNLGCVSVIHYCGISQLSARLLGLIFNYFYWASWWFLHTRRFINSPVTTTIPFPSSFLLLLQSLPFLLDSIQCPHLSSFSVDLLRLKYDAV